MSPNSLGFWHILLGPKQDPKKGPQMDPLGPQCAYPQASSSPDSDHAHCQHDVGVDNIERKAGDSENLPDLITSDCSTCLILGQTSYPASCVSLSVSTEPPCLIHSIVFELPQQSLASFFLARGPPSFFLQSS